MQRARPLTHGQVFATPHWDSGHHFLSNLFFSAWYPAATGDESRLDLRLSPRVVHASKPPLNQHLNTVQALRQKARETAMPAEASVAQALPDHPAP